MTILVAYATAHGSTRGVADRIAGRLQRRGFAVEVVPATPERDVEPYEAVVLGSAVHNGRWLSDASALARAAAEKLAARPTWLFSVCSIGDEGSFFPERLGRFVARRRTDPDELTGIRAATLARGHRYFAGVIQRDHWPLLGRLVLRAAGGRYGDHRNWPDIDTWADAIADDLVGDAERDRATPAHLGEG